jgi:hypothetical protein
LFLGDPSIFISSLGLGCSIICRGVFIFGVG